MITHNPIQSKYSKHVLRVRESNRCWLDFSSPLSPRAPVHFPLSSPKLTLWPWPLARVHLSMKSVALLVPKTGTFRKTRSRALPPPPSCMPLRCRAIACTRHTGDRSSSLGAAAQPLHQCPVAVLHSRSSQLHGLRHDRTADRF